MSRHYGRDRGAARGRGPGTPANFSLPPLAWVPLALALVAGAGVAAASVRHVASKPARPAAAKAAPASAASVAAAAPSAASAPVVVASAASAPRVAADLDRWCRQLSLHVPGVATAQCQAAGLQAGEGRSVKGTPLWVRDQAPSRGEPRYRILLLGGIHGDEFASVTLVFDWIARTRSGAGATMAERADAGIAWRIVPLVNPDGLMNAPATRVNAHGVDLNRNFPTLDWASSAQGYWVKQTHRDPRRFPGPRAMSEPETQFVQRQIEQFRPDLIVSVHAPYGLLDFDGPPPAPRRLGDLQLDPVGVYPGSLGNYGGLVKQVPVMTLELRSARDVREPERAAMWRDLQRWVSTRLAEGTAGPVRTARATRE